MSALVSVIMAAYNAEKYIAEAIQSVLDQSYENWELLVINDGSTDSTAETIQSFSDDRIIYFAQENKGVSAARNVGLDHMKGEYFCFLDADDALTKSSLLSRVTVFEKDASINFIDGKIEVRSEDMADVLEEKKMAFNGEPFESLLKLDTSVFFGPTWMIKNTAQPVRFNEQLTHAEDLLFYIEYASIGGRYLAVSDAIYQYRKGNESAMSDLDKLDASYKQLVKIVRDLDTKNSLKDGFEKKVKSIMVKSYIGNKQFFKGVRRVFEA